MPIARGLKLYGTDRALPRRRAHECTSRQCWRHCCHATPCATTGTGATAAAGAGAREIVAALKSAPPVSACTSRGVVGSQPVSWIGHVSCRMAHGAMQCLWKTQPHEPNASEHGVPLTMPSQRAMHSMPGWKSMGQGREQHMVGEERRTSRIARTGATSTRGSGARTFRDEQLTADRALAQRCCGLGPGCGAHDGGDGLWPRVDWRAVPLTELLLERGRALLVLTVALHVTGSQMNFTESPQATQMLYIVMYKVQSTETGCGGYNSTQILPNSNRRALSFGLATLASVAAWRHS